MVLTHLLQRQDTEDIWMEKQGQPIVAHKIFQPLLILKLQNNNKYATFSL